MKNQLSFVFFICSYLFLSSSLLASSQAYLPHFTNKSGEWQTSLTLSNPASVSTTINIKAYDEAGGQVGDAQIKLQAYASAAYELTDLFPNLATDAGWLQLESNRKNLDGLMTFTNLVTGGTSSLPLMSTNQVLDLPMLRNENDDVSGFVITNPNREAVELTLALTDLTNNTTQTIQRNLAAGAKLKGIAANYFAQVPATATLRIESSAAINGFALTFMDNMSQIVAVPADMPDRGNQPILQQQLDGIFALYDAPAMNAAISYGDADPFVTVKGLARMETNESMTPTHPADIGSITKTFVATLVLMQRDEGKLSLEDAISNWLPNFPRANEVTVRMLLNHTSGIFNYTSSETFINALIESYGENTPVTPQQILNFAQTDGPYVFDPGTSWGYSNTGYIMLGMILEAVGNEPLAQQLHSRILNPLGMDHTYLAGDESVPGRAYQYLYDDEENEWLEMSQNIHMSWAWAAGAMASTPEDLMTFMEALMKGELINANSVTEMITPTGPGIEAEYALGVAVGDFNGVPMIGHSGGTYGGSAFTAYFPGLDAAIAMQITESSDDDSLSHLLVGTLTVLDHIINGSNKKATAEFDLSTWNAIR